MIDSGQMKEKKWNLQNHDFFEKNGEKSYKNTFINYILQFYSFNNDFLIKNEETNDTNLFYKRVLHAYFSFLDRSRLRDVSRSEYVDLLLPVGVFLFRKSSTVSTLKGSEPMRSASARKSQNWRNVWPARRKT